MQGMVVVGLIVEEISNVDKKCVRHWSVKYRSRYLPQNIRQSQVIGRVSTSRRSTMQGLVVVGLIVEISNVDVKCVSHWRTKYRSRSPYQGTCSPYTEEKHHARFGGCRP